MVMITGYDSYRHIAFYELREGCVCPVPLCQAVPIIYYIPLMKNHLYIERVDVIYDPVYLASKYIRIVLDVFLRVRKDYYCEIFGFLPAEKAYIHRVSCCVGDIHSEQRRQGDIFRTIFWIDQPYNWACPVDACSKVVSYVNPLITYIFC